MIGTLSWYARIFASAARLQLSRGAEGQVLQAVVVSPLSAAIYMFMASYLGRSDLAAYVVFAPILAALWGVAINSAGETVATERGGGTLELLIASPAPAAIVLLGRVVVSTFPSLVAVPMSFVIAGLFGLSIGITEPMLFVATLGAVLVATAGIGAVMAAIFVLAHSTRLFQNVIGLPLYILSGIAFPIALLPDEIEPVAAFIPLAWGAALLRAASTGTGEAAPFALVAILVLAAVYLVLGSWLFVGIEHRVRRNGSLGSE